MAIVRKTPVPINKINNNVSLLKPKLSEVNKKGHLEVLKIPKYESIDYGAEVVGLVTDCSLTNNPDYVNLVVVLYYDMYGSVYRFTYNLTNQSADYLHRFASIFAEYKISQNLYSIIGKCFIGKIKKNKGYLNLVGIKSITKEEMNSYLESMDESEDTETEGDEYEE